MHRIIIIIGALLALAACTPAQTGAVIGGGTGAVVGASTTGNLLGTAVGATIGTVVGATAGEILGRLANDPNRCVYERLDGSRYIDVCPRG